MIIGVCGFSWTGSGAVIDLLSEFNENKVLDKMEFILPYYPDGLEDLEFHLTKQFSKYASSAVAIERFRRFMYIYVIRKAHKYQLDKDKLIKLVEDYISDLVQIKWIGYGASDSVLICSRFYKLFNPALIIRGGVRRILKFPQKKMKRNFNSYPAHKIELSIFPPHFNETTKKFVHNILKIYGAEEEKNIVLDQPFAANNPDRSFKYFKNPHAIIVDRDPRDVYLLMKKFLVGESRQIPCEQVEDFVKYYKLVRQKKEDVMENSSIIYISFEDLVYNYDETVNKICEFCCIKDHTEPFSKFKPLQSIKNTQLFKRFPEYQKDIDFIKKELPEYLYSFE